MNGIFRATEIHVETEQEWISTFKVLHQLHRNLQLIVQVASSDKPLLLDVIVETTKVHSSYIISTFNPLSIPF